MTSPDNLDNIMEFEHVIEVRGGAVIDAPSDIYAPETYVLLDADGQQVSSDHDLEHDLASHGWQLFTIGYSGQDRYRGGIMHSSEYIGGRLAEDILANDGYYVSVVISGLSEVPDSDTEDVGWAVLRHELREIDTRNSR